MLAVIAPTAVTMDEVIAQAAESAGAGRAVILRIARGASEWEVSVTSRGVAWVSTLDQPVQLGATLLRHGRFDRATLREALRDPRGLGFGSLLGEGLSAEELRNALLEHNAIQLGPLLGDPQERGTLVIRPKGSRAAGSAPSFTLDELRAEWQRLARVGVLSRSDAFPVPTVLAPAVLAPAVLAPVEGIPTEPRVRRVRTTGNMLATPPIATELRVGPAALQDCLRCLAETDGFCAAAISRLDNGVVLGSVGDRADFPLDAVLEGAAAALNAHRTHTSRQLDIDRAEDIVLTTQNHHFLSRVEQRRGTLFLLLVVDRSSSTLGMAQHALRAAESALKL